MTHRSRSPREGDDQGERQAGGDRLAGEDREPGRQPREHALIEGALIDRPAVVPVPRRHHASGELAMSSSPVSSAMTKLPTVRANRVRPGTGLVAGTMMQAQSD